ncbi:MAG: hypothetical protein N0C83_00425 [Candidatus Thiodiazotropha lotti]|nr:hypothetical protein [Candidatus Thiodiazotropha lotti]MCG7919968.1 hypothetical protein [Candidatus Thiodiazotropha lotti]MCG8001919.1 hypothetical protein [Candidatus Thiodiazotropha lotti]MCW4185537.1 hypothetical protein [Candidatus Thiodiazotropha lotti]MCW4197751.1 hypothetical protein [Candidatus Thiodiazotropha lotti]
MKLHSSIGMTALTIAALQSAPAYAAVMGSLVFTEPTATVAADETINVRVTLFLDENSDPLRYNRSAPPLHGWHEEEFPAEANGVPFASYERVVPFTTRTCSDTFTLNCGDAGSQYRFSAPTSDSWFAIDGTISPGDTADFLLYQLIPDADGADPGIYELHTAGLGLSVQGWDGSGHAVVEELFGFRTTCLDASCTFSREVAPIPIPAAVWLFGSALLGLVGFSRHRDSVG